jgi:hypothetical protein
MLEKMGAVIEARVRRGAIYDYDGMEIARAALQAIREDLPESVIRAGDNADYFCSEGIRISRMIYDGGIQTVFTAMIDAILDGKE